MSTNIINKIIRKSMFAKKILHKYVQNYNGLDISIQECVEINPCFDNTTSNKKRINLIIPSMNTAEAFAGITSALSLFYKIIDSGKYEGRIIITDASINKNANIIRHDFKIVDATEHSNEEYQIIDFTNRYKKTIPVRENDYFLTTAWWTTYNIKPILKWMNEVFSIKTPRLLYLIQDYEPYFYSWSTKYALAESTYHLNYPTIAIFNSKELHDFFNSHKYKFYKTFYIPPFFNEVLKNKLPKNKSIKKDKIILIYGRPNAPRNGFSMILMAMKLWQEQFPKYKEWTIISAGAEFDYSQVDRILKIKFEGKLSLEQYSSLLLKSYAGISLMISPHPSYPPLEMSTYGVKTITNAFENKNLATSNKNIYSIKNLSPEEIANVLTKICENYDGSGEIQLNKSYSSSGNELDTIVKRINGLISK